MMSQKVVNNVNLRLRRRQPCGDSVIWAVVRDRPSFGVPEIVDPDVHHFEFILHSLFINSLVCAASK